MSAQKILEGYYNVVHEQYATDHFTYGTTIVEASSKEEAMEKLNSFLATNPFGVYTPLPCTSIKHVTPLKVIF